MIVDCGAPDAITNGSVHYSATNKGSVAIIQCDHGLVLKQHLQISKCTENGSWAPDFSSQECVQILSMEGMC